MGSKSVIQSRHRLTTDGTSSRRRVITTPALAVLNPVLRSLAVSRHPLHAHRLTSPKTPSTVLRPLRHTHRVTSPRLLSMAVPSHPHPHPHRVTSPKTQSTVCLRRHRLPSPKIPNTGPRSLPHPRRLLSPMVIKSPNFSLSPKIY